MVISEILEALDLDRTRDVADGVIAVRVVTHLEHHQVFVVDVVGQPFGIDQEIRLSLNCGGEGVQAKSRRIRFISCSLCWLIWPRVRTSPVWH